jgi:hypothetical protein
VGVSYSTPFKQLVSLVQGSMSCAKRFKRGSRLLSLLCCIRERIFDFLQVANEITFAPELVALVLQTSK